MKYVIKKYSRETLVGEVFIDAESRKDAMDKYLADDNVLYTPESMSWPRADHLMCLDVEEVQNM